MKAKFYWVNNNAGNCIYINFQEKWYCDDAAPSGKWCEIDIYDDFDGRSTEERFSPTLEKLKAFLENPEAQGYEFERDYIENLNEIEAYEGKTIEEIEELENDDGYGCRRTHDLVTIVYIGEYDVDVPEFEVMTDEHYWTFDEDNVLKSVICYIDGGKEDLPVIWDDKGAYVEYNGQREYVLVITN